MLAGANQDAVKKIKDLKIENDKTKKIIENSMFISFLNNKLEMTHQMVFTQFYKVQMLYYQFITQETFFKAARDFEAQFHACMNVEKPNNQFNKEWKERKQREMMKFLGKITDTSEIFSETTHQSDGKRSAAPKGGAKKKKHGADGSIEADVNDAINVLNHGQKVPHEMTDED